MEIEKQQQQHKNSKEELKSSASSSPNHEFSFTISLHSSSTTPVIPDNKLALDLSPADDIFFHGHLLPLHLLSHLPVSPRSSTNSLDSFTLPIKDLLQDNNNLNHNHKPNKIITSSNTNENSINTDTTTPKSKLKPKSFSLFGWRKGCQVREREEKEQQQQQKKKQRFDQVSHILKRYIRMVRPLLFFKGRRENHLQLHRQQACSFSGNLSYRNKQDMLRGRRGQYSAPASMRTSPTNSGLLVPSPPPPPPSTSDSTMEELQAAIQAAIAHCKNSIAAEDKIIHC